MQAHSTAMTTRMTCRLREAIPSSRLVLKVLANDIRVARAKTLIGTCSKTGNGKRSRIATRHEVKVRDRHPVAAAEIVVVEVEIVADAAVAIAVAAEDAAAVEIAVDEMNDLAQRDRDVPKSVRAATSLVLPTRHRQLLEVNPVIQPLGHDVMTVRAMIVARDPNAALNEMRAATSRDQPLPVPRQPRPTFPMISVRGSLKNHRHPHGHHPFRNRQLLLLDRHAKKSLHKARKPLMRCCGIQIARAGNR